MLTVITLRTYMLRYVDVLQKENPRRIATYAGAGNHMNQKFAKYFVDNSTPVRLSATRCIVTHGYMCNGTSITVMATFRAVKRLAG